MTTDTNDNDYEYHFAEINELIPSENHDFIATSGGIVPLMIPLHKEEVTNEKFEPGTVYDMNDFIVNNQDNEKANEFLESLKNSDSGYFILNFTLEKSLGKHYFIVNQNEQIEFLEKADIDNMALLTLL